MVRFNLHRIAKIATPLLVALLLVALFVQGSSIRALRAEIDTLRTGITGELAEATRLSQTIEANQRTATENLGEVRRLLNLSPGTYRFSNESGTPDPSLSSSSGSGTSGTSPSYPDQLFFRGVDRIRSEAAINARERELATSLPAALRSVLATANQTLSLQSTGRLRWSVVDDAGARWVDIEAKPDSFILRTATGEVVDAESVNAVTDAVQSAIETVADRFNRFERVTARIDAYLAAADTTALLAGRNLIQGETKEGAGRREYSFVTADTGATAFSALVERVPWRMSIDGASVETPDAAAFIATLERRIEQTDPRTAAERATAAAFERIREIAADPAFSAYLADRGLRLRTEPRETLDFFLFELIDETGSAVGSFAVQKIRGTIYLADADELIITTLSDATQNPLTSPVEATRATGSTELPDAFPPGFRPARNDGTNVLLFGTHEEKADSIMLVHLSPEKTISMISIPRDIWWKQRKLNYYHEIFGSEALVAEISEMIAQPIDGWISVDMYAFIEVVDILGGIDVTLEESLIDPTYRVREEGRWSTLYYEAGTHHLSGIEALRLARSRHTSNDFDRAARQQKILAALREKINTLHAGNLDRVYSLVETVSRYIESSYSVWELAQFYLGYRNAEIVNRTGLTFDNVLYSTYSDFYLRGIDEEDAADDAFRGAWILLPRENDWDVIPWFVSENIR